MSQPYVGTRSQVRSARRAKSRIRYQLARAGRGEGQRLIPDATEDTLYLPRYASWIEEMEKRSRRRIRDLVALAAFQRLSQNEIACARISMMARSTNTPLKGRIQKRKTNHLQIITFDFQRTAGPYKRAKKRKSPHHSISLSQSANSGDRPQWTVSNAFRWLHASFHPDYQPPAVASSRAASFNSCA
jgi:hypothetical protein